MSNYNERIRKIIDSRVNEPQIVSEEMVENFAKKNAIKLCDDYRYFLLNYCNSYVKEGYYLNINSNNKLLKYEIDSFFGLKKDANNIEEQISFYQTIIPENLFPIAGIAGGDLICLDKEVGNVYMWFHDKENQVLLCANDFKELISKFEENNICDDKKVKRVTINDKLDLKMREMAKKYR